MKVETPKTAISPAQTPLRIPSTQGSRPDHANLAHGLHNAQPQLSNDQKLEKQVRSWVGQTFFGTLLKQMRDSPFKSELFSGGRGGEAFQEMYDGRLAQHMATNIGTKLVRPIVNKLKRPALDAYGRQIKTPLKTREAAHVGADHRA